MFLYELRVGEALRRRGIGTALVRALAERAVERKCYGMWVGVDADNEAALRTYRAGGSVEQASFELLEWRLQP